MEFPAAGAYLPAAVLTLCAAAMTTAETGAGRASRGAGNDRDDWDRNVLVAVDEFETLVRAAAAAKSNGKPRRKIAFGDGESGETDAVAAVVPPPPPSTAAPCGRPLVPIDGPVAVSAARDIVRRVMENIRKMHRKGGGGPVLTVHYAHSPRS